MQKTKFIVLDLETTQNPGKNNQSEIIEIGAVVVEAGQIRTKQNFNSLVKPPCLIQPQNFRVSGISDEMVARAPAISQVLPDFLSFIADNILVGHNITTFDGRILSREAELLELKLTNIIIDTLLISRKLFPKERTHGLDALAKRFGLKHQPKYRHRALDDAMYIAQTFIASWPHLQQSNINTLSDLLNLSRPKPRQSELF